MIGITDVNEPGGRAGCFPEALLRTFSGLRDCSPGKHSATGEDGGASGRKTQKQKALSSDRAFRLRCYDSGFPRRRCCAPFPGYGFCSPGKRSATGEDGGASDRKTQKQKAQSFDWAFRFI